MLDVTDYYVMFCTRATKNGVIDSGIGLSNYNIKSSLNKERFDKQNFLVLSQYVKASLLVRIIDN